MLNNVNYQEMKNMSYFEHHEYLSLFMEECKLYKDLTDDEILVLESILQHCDEFGYWNTFELKQLAKNLKFSEKKILKLINTGLLNRIINGMVVLQAIEINFGLGTEKVLYSELAVYLECENKIDDYASMNLSNWLETIDSSKQLSTLECE